MVTLEEMKKKMKLKLLLKGPTAAGKTFTCVKIMDVILKAEKRVLYLDHERSSILEIIKYFEDNNVTDLQNFTHEDYFSYNDLVRNIKKYTSDDENKVDLIVIDPLPLQEVCRISATDDIRNQGYYRSEGKIIKLEDIKNPSEYIKKIEERKVENVNTYSLTGWEYSLPNFSELKFKDMIVSLPVDIIATLLLPDEKNTLDPLFDYVVELSQTQVTDRKQKVIAGKLEDEYITKKVYKGIPKKIRGERIQQVNEMEDPWKAVMKPFCRKYLNKECLE